MFKLLLLFSVLGQSLCDRSFTLVLDTTNSMEAEILVVRANIEHVLNDTLNTYNNYVLVSFKDSAIEQIFTTPFTTEYLAKLNSLTTHGGADCPENSLAGIEAALRASDKQSTIFLFTDGYAKDFYNFRTIETLCKDTHSQVIIFLSGHCISSGNGAVGNVDVYYDIARACSGAMLKWGSLFDLREAFTYMKEIVNTEWTNITTSEKFTDFKQFTFSADRFTTNLMIVASGNSPTVEVVGTNYQKARTENIVRTRQPLVVRITPEVGKFIANIRDQGPTTVTIYERNNVPFQCGFSTKSPRTIRESSARPIAGWTNYIIINVDVSIKLRAVEWLNLGESVKQVLMLKQIASGSYVSSVFVEQGNFFRFWIVGEDRDNNQREIRGSSQILAPQVPVNEENLMWSKPEVEILDKEMGLIEYGAGLILAARISSFPKPDVRWEDESGILQSETVLSEIPSVYISYATIPSVSKNSTILCRVKNDEGEVATSIDVYVNRTFTFDVILSPEDSSVEFGKEHRLSCQIDAYPEAAIQWYLNNSLVGSSNFRLSVEDEELVIKNMGFEDIGAYECRVSNGVETKSFIANIAITGVEVPEIAETETEIHFKPSDTAEIQCRITKGKPVPSITWKYKSFNNKNFNSLPYGASNTDSDKIVFEKIDTSHGGVYRCVASNEMGEDVKDFDVKILSPPIIKNSELVNMTVKKGSAVHLPCEAESTPQPTVRWEMSQDDVIIAFDHRHWTDKKNTHHFIAQPNDSGNYHCVAENIVGKAEKTVVLSVLETPYIESQPERLYADVGGSVSLPCNVLSGNPKPTIRWEFRPKDSTVSTQLTRVGSSNDLKIKTVTKNDEGSYLCVAENQFGADSIKYQLIVH